MGFGPLEIIKIVQLFIAAFKLYKQCQNLSDQQALEMLQKPGMLTKLMLRRLIRHHMPGNPGKIELVIYQMARGLSLAEFNTMRAEAESN